ncbi:MAG: general stress protein CsbD [Ignavibacteriaceae bacterium]
MINYQKRLYMYQINDKGNWSELKEKIKLTYPTITEDDLALNDGDEMDLLTRLQNKLSKSKEEIITMIDKL